MEFKPVQIVTAGSLGATLNSSTIDMNQYFGGSIQAVWTGASVDGTFKLQISNDIVRVTPSTGDVGTEIVNWTDYTGSSTTAAGAGDFMWNMVYSNFRWVRLVFTRTSGTGTLNAIFSGKG